MNLFTSFVLSILALSVRLIIRFGTSEKILNSFTYSPIDQWESVVEGVYLRKNGFPQYSNDIVHQPPLAISWWSWVISHAGDYVILYFLLMELVMAVSIVKFCDVSINDICLCEQHKTSSVHPTSKEMLVSKKDFHLCKSFAILWYCFNPYSILAFAGQSTSIFWNVVCIWTMIAYVRDHLCIASCLCALGCYLRLYPGYLLIPIIAKAYFSGSSTRSIRRCIFRITYSIMSFTAVLAGLLYSSYIVEHRDWSFLESVYWHQIRFKDCSPQLGVYWYLFVEMFDHFHELFIWVFQLLLATLVISLGLRFYREPLFLGYVVLLITNVLQPYHSVGEFGYLLALLPLWSHLYKYTRIPLIVVLILLSSFILTPLLYYLWLQPGTANANFYFAACMVYAVGQIFLITDLMNSYVKREFLLRVGPKLELSSGQKLVLVHS